MNRNLDQLLRAAMTGEGDFMVTFEEATTLRDWEKAPQYFSISLDGKERFCGRLLVEVEEIL